MLLLLLLCVTTGHTKERIDGSFESNCARLKQETSKQQTSKQQRDAMVDSMISGMMVMMISGMMVMVMMMM